VSTPPDRLPAVTHCPFCGQTLGSFFGNHLVDGHWCERCQEAFAVVPPGAPEARAPGNAGQPETLR
jgi:hypothetical protein